MLSINVVGNRINKRISAIFLFCIMMSVALLIGIGSVWIPFETVVQVSLLLAVLLPSFLLALSSSSWLLPSIIAMWAFLPEVRRLFDWLTGGYTSISLLSIAPLLVSMLMLIPIIRKLHELPKPIQTTMLWFAITCGYGLSIGFVKNGVASLFDLAGYIIPLLIIPYIYTSNLGQKERDRWLSAYANIAVIVASYGLIQYLVAPPWDVFWMNHVEMNSIGRPEPLSIRVFSTLNSPGPAGLFLSGALAPMLLERRWRGFLGWLGVALVALCLALTMVRASWITLVIILVTYMLTNNSRHKLRSILSLLAFGTVMYVVLSRLPGAEAIMGRFQSLGSGSEDQSFNERLAFSMNLIPTLLHNPLGSGLGSIGVGTKLENGGALGTFGDFDNGFWAIFLTFGIGFGLFFFRGVWLVAKRAIVAMKSKSVPMYGPRLTLAVLTGAIVSLIFSNAFTGLNGVILWFLVGAGLVGTYRESDGDLK
jgi:putative inorganic carbon (HCO3(-)) transporter